MKKLLFILVTLCLFSVTVYGSQSVIINLNVHKITINSEENIRIIKDNTAYENGHSFFIADKTIFKVNIEPGIDSKIKSIVSNSDCQMVFENNCLTISNVSQDTIINIITDNSTIVDKVMEIIEDFGKHNEAREIEDTRKQENEVLSIDLQVFTKNLNEIAENSKFEECTTKANSNVKEGNFSKIIISKARNGRCLYQC